MKTSLRPIATAADASFAPPADGYVHVEPYGEYTFRVTEGTNAPRTLVMVIDEAAVDQQVATFRAEAAAAGSAFAGMLCDFDHFSLDNGQRSEAAAWVTDLEKRADGLWAKMRWTDDGLAAITGGRYRYTSSVHSPADCQTIAPGRVRPARLDRFALTNDPRMLQGAVRMQPISSRQDPAGLSKENTTALDGRKGNAMDYKTMLVTMLGLPATATDEEIKTACESAQASLASCAQTQTDNTALKSRAEAAEKLVAGIKADATLTTLEGEGYKFTSRDEVKTRLVADHDNALAFIRLQPPPAAAGGEPLRSRKDTQTPTLDTSAPDKAKARTDFVTEVQKRFNFTSRADAVARAQADKPELWK
jgi:phage I-like protein